MNSEPKTEPNVKQAVPFFLVTDIEASVRYYVDGLGFKMTNQWIDKGKLRWCWLEHGHAALMLQEFWRDGQHSNVPAEKLGVGVSICFICLDALAIYREVTARGIQASEPFVGNGMWVTSLADPDGYRLDFESYTDVPEDTRLSEYEGRKIECGRATDAHCPSQPPVLESAPRDQDASSPRKRLSLPD